MKKLVLMLTMVFTIIALVSSPPVHAQLIKKITVVKDSTVNADNTVLAIGSADFTYRGVQVHCTKVSGTVAGKAVLEGLAPDGTNWIGIDSLTFADQAVNFKLFTFPSGLPHQNYRIKVTETGTGKIKPIVAYTLRRT